MTEERSNRPNVSVIQLVGGALAALTAAVVASTLGVEGTIMGAAVGSVIATAGGAWYNWSLEKTHERLRSSAQMLMTSSRSRVRKAGPSVAAERSAAAETAQQAAAVGQSADEVQPAAGYDEVSADPAEAAEPGESRNRRRWMALAIGGVGAFLIAMAAITIFELATGQPLAATVGGKQVTGSTISPKHETPATPAPTSSETHTSTPSPETSNTASPTPTEEPTATLTTSPTPTPSTPTPPAQTPTPAAATPGG